MRIVLVRVLEGSIPAHTGKPCRGGRWTCPGRVYPRPHGEAGRQVPATFRSAGLSPPTRGSPNVLVALREPQRSIPAHTGKPPGRRRSVRPSAVYPRPHGEAATATTTTRPRRGLSPPTRGSHHDLHAPVPGRGSIPAHTGKPARSKRSGCPMRVYPRPHGEASASFCRRESVLGLSPPTRGSRLPPLADGHGGGSIPAHTGKPRWPGSLPPPTWVYPRPHGEAHLARRRRVDAVGLSPPTRGSPSRSGGNSTRRGSIPAHTGKPQ